MKTVISKITKEISEKFEECGYDKCYGKVSVSNRIDLCQFQCNGALAAAKKYKKSPIVIAEEVVNKIENEDIFESISIAGAGFINLTLKDSFLERYMNEMYKDERLGCDITQNPKKVIVDYGGANVAKALHVGHLRSAIIGESIKRIIRFMGHEVIGDVHLGDFGLQMGEVIVEVKRNNPDLPYFDENFQGEYPTESPFTIEELNYIYPEASNRAKEDENVMNESRKATLELQQGRRGYIALWKHMLNISVADLKKNYGDLNVIFDLWKGESDCNIYIGDMLNYLKSNNYAYESQGALVVDISKADDKYEMPPFLVLKSDGAALYGTTDLATIIERVKDYSPNEIIYLADKRQILQFEQLFRCARKTKIAADNLKLDFISFGTMNGKDGKPFKTRAGGVMKLEDLIDIIKSEAKNKLSANRNMSEEEINEISRKVGIAALKYGDLSNQPSKDYVFDIERFSSFEGNTGPYILYTVVRIKSILAKVKESSEIYDNKIISPQNDSERELMLKISKFNEIIEISYEEKAPYKICEYIYDLSNTFNRFYNHNKIISEENIEKKTSWINLITLTKKVLEVGLDLIGVETVDKM